MGKGINENQSLYLIQKKEHKHFESVHFLPESGVTTLEQSISLEDALITKLFGSFVTSWKPWHGQTNGMQN